MIKSVAHFFVRVHDTACKPCGCVHDVVPYSPVLNTSPVKGPYISRRIATAP